MAKLHVLDGLYKKHWHLIYLQLLKKKKKKPREIILRFPWFRTRPWRTPCWPRWCVSWRRLPLCPLAPHRSPPHRTECCPPRRCVIGWIWRSPVAGAEGLRIEEPPQLPHPHLLDLWGGQTNRQVISVSNDLSIIKRHTIRAILRKAWRFSRWVTIK